MSQNGAILKMLVFQLVSLGNSHAKGTLKKDATCGVLQQIRLTRTTFLGGDRVPNPWIVSMGHQVMDRNPQLHDCKAPLVEFTPKVEF